MKTRKFISVLLTVMLLMSVLPPSASAYSKEQATLTFTNAGITETVSSAGYTISGNTLTITAAGTYRITGSASEGNVVVNKNLANVTLILDNLKLTSATTAPIAVKKSSSVLIKLVGETTLTNNEDASTEETNADFEGAAIKVKSGSSLTIFGDGILNAVGNAKNAIKGAAESSLTVDGGTIKATAVNNGVAFDGSIVINSGTFNITAGNDAIKSEPDEGDTVSKGELTINGGTFNIVAQGDGIQAAEKLTINNGAFDIKTLNGYNSSGFDKDTMSCKGIKVSGNNDTDSEAAPTCRLIINGGTFNLNTADDALHSDGYADITGGTFYIYTGDDGVHADATLTLGEENGYERDPEIYIYSSYEGLEGSVVNSYSGKYYVIASDDGINAAGGSSNGSGGGNHDPFRPGGGGPGGPGQSSSNYSLNIYGGSFYVDCQGDGLDSNGALNLLGGDITVLSMRSGGDNSPLDADGTITLNGTTVFAAGSRGMGVNLSNSSQKAYTSTSSYNSGTVINVKSSGTTLRSEKLVRNISYLLYSQPNLGTCSISTSSSVDNCKSNAFAHNWDNGTVENAASVISAGTVKYTCLDCGAFERKTVAKLGTVTEYTEDDTEINSETENDTAETEAETTDTEYTATFVTDPNATVNIYYTQDYTVVSETNITTAIARSASTGKPDGSGDGQINFSVELADGYEIDSIAVDGSYKNLKDIGSNIYRVTKIAGDLTITITTKQVLTENTETETEVDTDTSTYSDIKSTDNESSDSDKTTDSETSTENDDTAVDTGTDAPTDSDTPTNTENPTDTDKSKGILGDVDGDGKVTMMDVVLLQKYIAELVKFTDEQKALADVSRDSNITMLDVTTMQKFIAELIEKF